MKKLMNNISILDRVYENLNVSEEQKNGNIANAKRIYQNIPNPDNPFSNNVGLIVGKVQSGKTANIIALSGLCFDNEHRMMIMLLGDTNNLLEQNYERIKQSYENIDKIKVFKKSKDGDFNTLDADDLEYLYNNGYDIIICSLKHYKHIDELCNVIKKTSFCKTFSLIVDDESDDISQNTNKNKFDINENVMCEKERSSTNNSIVELKNILYKNSYISVTATPQANILLQKFQTLAPNYCTLIEPGKGYCGLLSFHSQDSNKVELIKDFKKETFLNNIPKSLYNALIFFVSGAVVRTRKEKNEYKHSMLIHPSKKIIEHNKLYDNIFALISNIRYGLKFNNQTGKAFYELVKVACLENNFCSDCTYEEVKNVINSVKIHCINGESDVNNLNQKMSIMPFHIIIGGDMLDRGITVPGLAVSYMTRESKIGQVDTLLQRARWFGYKLKYFDTCKVYLTPTLKEQYEEIIEDDESLWEFLSYCSNLKYDIRNENIELVLNNNILRPTSSAKAEYSNSTINSSESQKYFSTNSEYNNQNLSLLKKYEDRTGTFIKYNTIQNHKKIDISYKEFIYILDNFKFADKSIFNTNADINVEKIKLICSKYGIEDSESISLLYMRYETKETRSTVDESTCKIINLMQGHSEGKDTTDCDFYPGDRKLVSDKIMLQAHHVILKNKVSDIYNKNDEIIMLVVLFPDSITKVGLVTRKSLPELMRKYIN